MIWVLSAYLIVAYVLCILEMHGKGVIEYIGNRIYDTMEGWWKPFRWAGNAVVFIISFIPYGILEIMFRYIRPRTPEKPSEWFAFTLKYLVACLLALLAIHSLVTAYNQNI